MGSAYLTLRNKISAQGVSSLAPVYFFYGGEEFFKDEAVSIIEKKVVEPATRDFNYNLYHLPETDIATVIYTANSLPFMTGKRLVIVRNFGKLPASQDELFESYIDNPSRSTCVVLVGGEKNPKRKIFDKLEQKSVSVNFYNLFGEEVVGYVIDMVSKEGKSISSDAAELLYEMTGRNMLEIKHETDKLLLYAGAGGEITAADVERCCGHFRENTGYDLVPLITCGETKKAAGMLHKMFEDGEDELKILSAIAEKFKQFHRFHGFIGRGENEYAAMAQAGVRFYKDAFLNDARRLSVGQTKTGLRLILAAELRMKSGLNCAIELEKLLLNLCQL